MLWTLVIFGKYDKWELCLIVKAIFYVTRSGCAWRMLPQGFPLSQTVYGHCGAGR